MSDDHRLEVVPLHLRDAYEFVRAQHRHRWIPPVGSLFAIGAARGEAVVGVVIVGRALARGLDDAWTAEVSRLATDGAPNACSLLYAAAWRACRAMGYRRLVTYTLASEPGTSLRAAGWHVVGEVRGRSWSCKVRPRVDLYPLQDKLRWEAPA